MTREVESGFNVHHINTRSSHGWMNDTHLVRVKAHASNTSGIFSTCTMKSKDFLGQREHKATTLIHFTPSEVGHIKELHLVPIKRTIFHDVVGELLLGILQWPLCQGLKSVALVGGHVATHPCQLVEQEHKYGVMRRVSNEGDVIRHMLEVLTVGRGEEAEEAWGVRAVVGLVMVVDAADMDDEEGIRREWVVALVMAMVFLYDSGATDLDRPGLSIISLVSRPSEAMV